MLLFLACPLPDLFDEEANSKRARIDHIPMPPLPPAATYTPPTQLIVPQVKHFSGTGEIILCYCVANLIATNKL